jgi:hypothetical protein
MRDERTDRIAREAARLIETGKVDSIEEAIRRAVEALKLRGAPPPTHGRVRQHAQAIRMQAMGDVAYAQSVREVLRIAEEVMTLLTEFSLRDARRTNGGGIDCELVGRGARGLVDVDPTLHIRAYTDLGVDRIAEILVEHGYEEPSFQTVETRHGRMNRLLLADEGVELIITRCPPSLRHDAAADLFSGERIDAIGLDDLRRHLSET